jgi:hypothetical protein
MVMKRRWPKEFSRSHQMLSTSKLLRKTVARLGLFAAILATIGLAAQIAIGVATFHAEGYYSGTFRFGGYALTLCPGCGWGDVWFDFGFRDESSLLPSNAPRPFFVKINNLEWRHPRRFPMVWWPIVRTDHYVGNSDRIQVSYLDVGFEFADPIWFSFCFIESIPLFIWYRRQYRRFAQRARGFEVSEVKASRTPQVP